MFEFELFYDGQCPICTREIAFMRRLDRGRGRLKLTDLHDADIDFEALGLTHDELMREIHGRDPSNTIYRGVAVFRRAYRAVGLGWILAPTGWPLLRPLFDRLYRWFARNRLRMTGRDCSTGACARK